MKKKTPARKSTVKKAAPKKPIAKNTSLLKSAEKPRRATPAKTSVLPDTVKTASQSDADIFPVVGIGASAGGLEALEGFFDNVPDNSSMAYVVIQHLSPAHKSIMDTLLQKHTGMAVTVIEDGMRVRPNRVYLNPPDKNVGIMNNTLVLMEPEEAHAVRLPIDFFFRSLARDHMEKAVCIVLSGTGADGTQGLKEIKGEGGITMAQEEAQAKYDNMPRSAINTGMVDYVLPVEKMPAQLLRYMKHPVLVPSKGVSEQQYMTLTKKIFLLIRTATGHDFSDYKPGTIHRRINRRMSLHQIDNIELYLRYLQQNAKEVDALFKDLLIGVTSFFRDSEAFEFLDKKIIPDILKNSPADSVLRVWVPGCATGEEAYSLAILFLEKMEKRNKLFTLQVFATDIDDTAIEFARAGIYPESIAADVTPARLKRYFIKEGTMYLVRKEIREPVVFAVQNLIKDPPFSKLDMVSCRNLLIYMAAKLQKKVLPLFHYTLNTDGCLFLGSSESIGEFADLFSPVNTKWKIYSRKGISLEKTGYAAVPYTAIETTAPAGGYKKEVVEGNARLMAEKIVFQEHTPAYVLINEKHDIIYMGYPLDSAAYKM